LLMRAAPRITAPKKLHNVYTRSTKRVAVLRWSDVHANDFSTHRRKRRVYVLFVFCFSYSVHRALFRFDLRSLYATNHTAKSLLKLSLVARFAERLEIADQLFRFHKEGFVRRAIFQNAFARLTKLDDLLQQREI
jgi:hypothetical protein